MFGKDVDLETRHIKNQSIKGTCGLVKNCNCEFLFVFYSFVLRIAAQRAARRYSVYKSNLFFFKQSTDKFVTKTIEQYEHRCRKRGGGRGGEQGGSPPSII